MIISRIWSTNHLDFLIDLLLTCGSFNVHISIQTIWLISLISRCERVPPWLYMMSHTVYAMSLTDFNSVNAAVCCLIRLRLLRSHLYMVISFIVFFLIDLLRNFSKYWYHPHVSAYPNSTKRHGLRMLMLFISVNQKWMPEPKIADRLFSSAKTR